MRQLESLQAYRGIAAILVVLYHVTDYLRHRSGAPFLGGFFDFGFVGVGLFFVLSGFIILWVNESAIGHAEKLQSYALKRLIRIYPIYWAITAVKLASIVALPSNAKDYERSSAVIVKSILLVPQVNLPLIGAAWTLSYELFFYALFGMAVLLGTRFAYALAGSWLVGILAYAVLAGQAGDGSSFLASFVLNIRNLEFLLGCLGAFLIRRWQVPQAKILLGLGVALFLVAGVSLDVGWGFQPLPFGIAAFLIVVGSTAVERRGRVSVPRILVFLGDASYSIYLLAFAWVEATLLLLDRTQLLERLNLQVVGVLVAVLAVSGGAGVYYLVERPLLGALRSLGKKPSLVSTCIPSSSAIRMK